MVVNPKKRKLHAFDSSLTTPWIPEKMTIPEIQAYLMEYNVPCPKVSKAELLKIFKEKVYPKLQLQKPKRQKINSSHQQPFLFFPNSPPRSTKKHRKDESVAMEVENEVKSSGSKRQGSGRKLFQFGNKTRKNLSKGSTLNKRSYKPNQQSRFSSPLEKTLSSGKRKDRGLMGLFGPRGFSQTASPIFSDRQQHELGGEGGNSITGSISTSRGASISLPTSQRSTSHNLPYTVSAGRARTHSLLDKLDQEDQGNSSRKPKDGPRLVDGNKIQFGRNVFGLGNEVVYRGAVWQIVGIDFDCLSLNIQKGSRVKNVLPQYLKMITVSEDETKTDDLGIINKSKGTPIHYAGHIPNTPPKTTHRGRHFASAFVVVCLAVVGLMAYLLKQPSPTFCDFQDSTAGEDDCTPCPRHATCRNGKAKCWDSYDLHWDVCRKTKQLEKYISTIVQTAHIVLKEKRGEAECRLGPRESEDRIISESSLSKNEIKLLIAERLGLNSTAIQGVKYKEHWRFLNAFGLAHIEFVHYFESYKTRNFWYSREATKTWRCLLKELLHRQSRLIFVIIFSSGSGLWAYWRFLCWRKYHHETVPMASIVKKCAMEILHQAADSFEPVVAIDQLKETILLGEAEGLVGEKPDKAAWKLGYSNLRQDRRVMALMKVLDGKNTPCLKLRTNASTGVLGASSPHMGVLAV